MGTKYRKRSRSSNHSFTENSKSLPSKRRRPQLWYRPIQEPDEQEEEEALSNDDLDLLSNLPDSVLSHVISFLDTKTAIKTSILSTRYRSIWKQLHTLDFKPRFSSPGPKQPDVYRIFHLREPVPLTHFRLSVYRDIHHDFVLRCLDYAVAHKVQNLRFGAGFPIALPVALLNSTVLVSLRLKNAVCRSIELPMTVNLPNLKSLYLKYFEFSSKSYNGDLFRGCPSLESLVLHKCLIKPGDGLKVLDLNCGNLRSLEVKHWRSPWRCFSDYSIVVNAPKLVSFRFQGCIVRMIFEKLCMDFAYINVFEPTARGVTDERKQLTSASCANMLWYLRNVKLLTLSWGTLKVLCGIRNIREEAPVVFTNLKLIKLTTENVHSELRIHAQSLRKSLEAATDDVVVLNDLEYRCLHAQKEERKCYTKYEETRTVTLPTNVVLYLLENSPSAEFVHIEIPEELSDESILKLDTSL